ncbi:MAG TPA: hypothetical protein VLH60_02190 [Sedimentisphaerales bacterium]|nr:hypothetical protein [Sedimentisphaerales bacterium]
MTTIRIAVMALLVVAAIAVVGCREKGDATTVEGIDLTKPIAEIKAAAENMDIAQLRKMAEKYIGAIKNNETAVAALMEKQKALPLDKIASDGQKIMEEVKELQTSIARLHEVFKVYYDALVAKGGDTSGLQAP